MPTYLTPGVYFEAVDADRGRLEPARVDVCGFVGVCGRGPLDTPVRLTTWAQFRSVFGAFRPVGLLPYAVKAFFDNGGRACYVVRVAAPTVDGLGLAGVAQPADRRSSVLADASAVAPGAAVTVEQAGTVHTYLAVEVDPGTGVVTWDRPLAPEYDLSGPPVSLSTGAGSASVTLAGDDGAGLPCLRVAASSPGSWGDGLRVTVSRSAGTATVTSPTAQPPGGLASVVDAVAGFEPGALVLVGQAGVAERRVVSVVDPVGRRLDWDVALPAAFDLTKPVRLEVEAITLGVVLDGTPLEVHPGLSLRPEHPRFAPTVLAGQSALVRGEAIPAGPHVLPRAVVAVPLRGGRDGTAGLRPVHLLGDASDPARRGLRAYEPVPEPALVALPDLVAPAVPATVHAPPPPTPVDPCAPSPPATAEPPSIVDPAVVEAWAGFGVEEVFAAQAGTVEFCGRDRVALLDPPRPLTPGGSLDVAALVGWRQRFDSSYAALYAPWIRVLDPAAGGLLRAVPPSGHVAGVIGRVDAHRGPGHAPANEVLQWAYELDAAPTAGEQGVLNPIGVNCLRALPGRGLRVYGARTLAGDPALRFLNVRRQLLAIRRTFATELQWAVFEPADLSLRRMLVTAISGYLQALWLAGELAGASPEEAFFVRADDELNPPEDAGNGQLLVEVGVAPVLPAEFVVLRIGRTEAGLELEER